jgi:hypothetical protein
MGKEESSGRAGGAEFERSHAKTFRRPPAYKIPHSTTTFLPPLRRSVSLSTAPIEVHQSLLNPSQHLYAHWPWYLSISAISSSIFQRTTRLQIKTNTQPPKWGKQNLSQPALTSNPSKQGIFPYQRSSLTYLFIALVRKRLISTWLSSGTSTPANPPPPVQSRHEPSQ